MRLSRRTNTIILWVISIGLLVGMIITFTPTLGRHFGLSGSGGQHDGVAALVVNGEPVTQIEVVRAQQNPLYSAVSEGEVADDLELLLADSLIEQKVLDQAAARTRVSNGEVRKAVNDFREQRGVAGSRNDQAYLQLISRSGFTDQSFRAFMREQLRLQKYRAGLTEGVEVSEPEVEAYYQTHQDRYRSEDRIRARMISVDDETLAQDLRNRALQGEDFAALAAEYSSDRADRQGALGAPSGSTDPQPVGRAALPTAVADAAFALAGPGLTEVVASNDLYYLVSVEEFLPSAVRPLEEVHDQVQEDALAAKQDAEVERVLAGLREKANIDVPEGSILPYNNPVIARVGDAEIHASDLVRATYTNSQIQQALNPQTATLITRFFKPNILEQLIQRELAYQGAKQLDATFFGSKSEIAQSALDYISRDAVASEDGIQEYYQANERQFTIPAEAEAKKVTFATDIAAMAFRDAILSGTPLEEASAKGNGQLEDLGTVHEGDLESELDTALFATDAFAPLPESDLAVSDVLVISKPQDSAQTGDATQGQDAAASDGTPADAPADAPPPEDLSGGDAAASATNEPAAPPTYVVLVAKRTPERLRPLEEVRDQVKAAVLNQERSQMRDDWLTKLRDQITVENLLVAQASEAAPAPTTTSTQEESPPATLEEAQARAATLTEELRSLSTRTDLSAEEQDQLAVVRANLQQAQSDVAGFTGARDTYTVQKGDTLSAIAESYYQDSSNWQDILKANSYLIDNENLIFPGFVLLIPELGSGDQTN